VKTGESHEEAEGSFGFDAVITLAGFAVRSVLRRKWLATGCFIITVAMTAVAWTVMPRTYEVEVRILTHPSYIIPNITRPGLSLQEQSRQALAGVTEIVRARDTLAAIVTEAKMIEHWAQRRSAVGRLKDALREAVLGPMTEADLREAIVNMLEKDLWVGVENEVIIITSHWTDPESAFALAEAAKNRFLEHQRKRERQEVEETIALLERGLAATQPSLEAAANELNDLAKRRRVVRRPIRPRPAAAPGAPDRPEGGDDLEQRLETQRLQVREIEQGYQARVRTAQERLTQLRASLGPRHPDVVAATRDLEQQSRPPEQLAMLKAQEGRLEREMAETRSRSVAVNHAEELIRGVPPPGEDLDPDVERSMSNYRRLEQVQAEAKDRLENARLDLVATDVAFRYRYMVTLPPIMPKKPTKPQPAKIFVGGAVCGILLGLFFSIFIDLRSRRILERWQAEKALGLPVIGELTE
jgi:hypothetical protein